MTRITPAGDADRAYLLTVPTLRSGGRLPVSQWGDAYAHRQAQAARRDIERGDVPSIPGGRAHVLTPEHPERRVRAKLEGSKRFAAAAAKSKYTARLGATPAESGQAPSAPSQRVTGAFAEGERPRHHQRLRGRSHIPYGDNGEIYTRNTDREAEAVLRYARDLEPQGRNRITMQVFDCSASRTGDFNGWFPVFSHTWKYGGISLDDFYELLDAHGGSLEQFLIDQINGGATYKPPWGHIHHICQYEITILPRARLGG